MLLWFGVIFMCITYSSSYEDNDFHNFPSNYIFGKKGGTIRQNLEHVDYLRNFTLIHNGTYTYKYVQNNEQESNLPTNVIYENRVLKYNNIHFNCSGIWQIKSDELSMNYTIIVVNRIHITTAIPAEVNRIRINDSVTIHMPKISKRTVSCYLLHIDPYTDDEATLYNSTNSYLGFTLSQYACSVTMRIQPDSNGKWALVQLVEGNQLKYGKFHINLVSNQSQKTSDVDAIVGTSHKFLLDIPQTEVESILNCELLNPDGEKVVSLSKQCEYEISKVSFEDAGNWTMLYDFEKTFITYKKTLNLIVHEPKVETLIEKNNVSDIHLLCYVKFDAKKQFCYFEHPNGTIYRNHDFIGNEKYQFHTNYSDPTSKTRESKYCGMTITSPNNSDFGAWRCYMKIVRRDSNWTTKVGSILHVESSPGTEESKIQHKSSNIYVHLNETFKISCTANKIVEHCWFESPNKTIFEIKQTNQNYRYKYEGRGFQMGDCGATIENASFDSGDWKCIMKLMNDTQLVEEKISVTVTKSPVIAKESKMIYTGSPITMSCIVIPNETFDFDVCRWIKPNGYGIHYESDQHYQLIENNHRECSLSVTELTETGRWTCILESKIMSKIGTATVEIVTMKENKFSLLLCLLAAGFGIIASCVTFFLCRKQLRHQRENELQLK